MNTLSYRTISANETIIKREWWLVDAENQTLGRLCSEVAAVLRGKNKPYFTPHADCGDYVIIINADKFLLSGKKMDDKDIITYTGYPGGQRITNPRSLLIKKPTAMMERTIKGMLPHNTLGTAMHRKLFVYAGAEHPHAAQKPQTIKF